MGVLNSFLLVYRRVCGSAVQVLVDGRQLLLLVGVGSPSRRVHGVRGAAATAGLQGLHRARGVRAAGGCGEDPPGGRGMWRCAASELGYV